MRLTAVLILAALNAWAGDDAIDKRRSKLVAAFTDDEKLEVPSFEEFVSEPIRDWEAHTSAILGEGRRDSLSNPLRLYLLHDDEEVAAFAAKLAGDAEFIELIPELEETYARGGPMLRLRVVESAGVLGSVDRAKVRPLLAKALGDGDRQVRLSAVIALTADGDERAKLALLGASKDPFLEVRYRVLAELARRGERDAQDALLADAEQYVDFKELGFKSFLYGHALGLWGDDRALRILIEQFQSNYIRWGTIAGLASARPLDENAKKTWTSQVRRKLKTKRLGVDYTEILSRSPLGRTLFEKRDLTGELKDPDVRIRLIAMSKLARLHEEGTETALARATRDNDYRVRYLAARGLGARALGSAEPRRALVALLRDPEPRVRAAAVAAIGRQDFDEAIPSILRALEDRSPTVRTRALRAVAHCSEDRRILAASETAARSLQLLFKAKGPVERAAARDALVAVGWKAVFPRLVKELDSSKQARREAAFSVLRSFRDGAAPAYDPKSKGGNRKRAVQQWRKWWSDLEPTIKERCRPPNRKDVSSFAEHIRRLRTSGLDVVFVGTVPNARRLLRKLSQVTPSVRLALVESQREKGQRVIPWTRDPLVIELLFTGWLERSVDAVKQAVALTPRPGARKVVIVTGTSWSARIPPSTLGDEGKATKELLRTGAAVHVLLSSPHEKGSHFRTRAANKSTWNKSDENWGRALAAATKGSHAAVQQDEEQALEELVVMAIGPEWRSDIESFFDFQAR